MFSGGCPERPDDPELRDAIEKLAVFVARNGPNFEEMTRQKQSGNPKFHFMYPEHSCYPYYRYCVEMEMKRLQQPQAPIQQAPPQFDVASARERIKQFETEIMQSEANLRGQQASFPLLKEGQFRQAIMDAENGKIAKFLQQISLDVSPLTDLLAQLSSKCSKDTVTACKKWILDNCVTDQMREIILMYLLHRVREPSSSDQFRLHLLYLVNDWAHYSQRKHQDGVTQMLSRYVPQMYAWLSESTQDRSIPEKLDKLLGVWEGHKYFNDNCFKQLRNPSQIFQNANQSLAGEHAKLAITIDAQFMAMSAGYEQQHNEFVAHHLTQIAMIKDHIERELNKDQPKSLLELDVQPPAGMQQRRSRFDQSAAAPSPQGDRPSRFGQFFSGEQNRAPQREGWKEEEPEAEADDIEGTPINEEELIPKCEYWDTPAGLMLQKIDIHDVTYKPLDPSAIRLVPKMQPSQHLNRALQVFYMEGPECPPRDEEGWEQGGLAAYYDRKMHIRQLIEEKQKAEGKTIEDMITNKMTQDDVDEEWRERERARKMWGDAVKGQSESKQKEQERGRRSRSRSSSTSSSESSSSDSSRGRRSRGGKRAGGGRKSRSISRSPRRRSPSRSRSHSRSSSPRRRSPTPEDFAPIPRLQSFRSTAGPSQMTPLSFENKGAMLMQKMGWKGTGLGAKETGIQEPINAGEIRDRTDMYKGLGQSADEFESYRKQLSSGYHTRNQAVFERRGKKGD